MGRDIRGEARFGDRIGIEAARYATVLIARGDGQGTGRQIHQIAGDVEGKVGKLGFARVAFRVADEVQHRLGDPAGAAEYVERHARRGAARGRTERLLDFSDVD